MISNRRYQECPICKDMIATCGLSKHMNSCKGQKRIIKNTIRPYSDVPGNCQFCNKLCKNGNSLTQHELRCPNNPNRRDYDRLTKYMLENVKGHDKYTNPDIMKQSESLKESYRNGNLDKYTLSKLISFKAYTYQDQIDNQIAKWFSFLDTCTIPVLNITQSSIHPDGYTCVYSVDNIHVQDKDYGYILKHILILETLLHRKLNENEEVHHIDYDKTNDSVYNLIIFQSHGDHTRFHKKQKAQLRYDEISHTFICI